MATLEEKLNKSFSYLDKVAYQILETYSNVHRGTGHNSIITTALFEQAREKILEYLQLKKKKYVVVFCSPLRFLIFKNQLKNVNFYTLSSKDLGIPFFFIFFPISPICFFASSKSL